MDIGLRYPYIPYVRALHAALAAIVPWGTGDVLDGDSFRVLVVAERALDRVGSRIPTCVHFVLTLLSVVQILFFFLD